MTHSRRKTFVQSSFIIVLFAVTFGVVLPWYCKDWLYSMYFTGHPNDFNYVKRAVTLNEERLDEAVKYFQEMHLSTSDTNMKNEHTSVPLDITIAIMTAQRHLEDYFPRYWIQTLAEVHKQYIKDTLFPHKRIFICNVDEDESYAGELSFISDFMEVISRFGGDYPGEKLADDYAKTKDDYAFCLKQTLTSPTKHVIVLEDDVLIRPKFFSALYNHIHTNLPHLRERDARRIPWALVKLYYPEKWHGYSFQLEHVVELAAVALFGGFIMAILHDLVSLRPFERSFSIPWCLVGAVYFVCVCVSVGRPYVVEFLRGTFSQGRLIPAHDCCTQAVLYHGDVVENLSKHLYETASEPYDLMIARWTKTSGHMAYLTQPNMVKHIGMVSTGNDRAKTGAEFMF